MPLPFPANRKRQLVWEDLRGKMAEKRTKTDAMKRTKGQGSSAPHEIIVQKLSSEADTRQTYRPIQPREFVEFPFEDLTLANLRSACASHFNFPVASCDILVTNKGPSCSNILQIPHRKDKVSLQHHSTTHLQHMNKIWDVDDHPLIICQLLPNCRLSITPENTLFTTNALENISNKVFADFPIPLFTHNLITVATLLGSYLISYMM